MTAHAPPRSARTSSSPGGAEAGLPDLDGTRVAVTMGGIPLFGQERGNIQVFHALRDVGVDALFVTNAGWGHESIQPALDALGLRWDTAHYPGRWARGRGPQWLWGRLKESVRSNRGFLKAARAYRPTHVHTMNEQYATELLPAARLLGVPMVYRVGDRPRSHRGVFRAVWKWVLAPSIDQFVAISQFVADRLVEVGVPRGKIRVIYSYPPERPPLAETDLPSDVVAPHDGRTVTYVGQITAEKGVGMLVQAATSICREKPDVRFLLAGDYSWRNPFAEDLVSSVESAGLGDRIRFLGHVEDIGGLLSVSDVHTAPSVCEEALGNVVLEAKQAGVPSVVFPSGGLPELAVERGRDAVVCSAPTISALVDGLRHYLDLPDDALRAAGGAAHDSLDALGITREAFLRAWADVYAQTQPDAA